MNQQVSLIVGLGNPGPEYEQTRHNAGAWFVERLASDCHTPLRPEKKFQGQYAKVRLAGQDVHLLIPSTYMNRSGQAVAALAGFYKLPPESILVAHDELDIEPGTARLKVGGGHGGHNGLRDIVSKLGNNKNFARLRLGIGHPGSREQVTGYVLGRAPQTERDALNACIDETIRVLPEIVSGQWQHAMNRLHTFKG